MSDMTVFEGKVSFSISQEDWDKADEALLRKIAAYSEDAFEDGWWKVVDHRMVDDVRVQIHVSREGA